jgi:predicted DNA-binding transcriptional regulator AlpA
MTDEFIRMAELRAKYAPVAKSTIYLWISQKRFPPPYSLGGGGAVAWRKSEIQQWMDSRESRAS